MTDPNPVEDPNDEPADDDGLGIEVEPTFTPDEVDEDEPERMA